MELKTHLYRLENIKAIHDLAKAGVDHHVISVFLTAEGIKLTTLEVTNIINTYDALGKEKHTRYRCCAKEKNKRYK